MLLHEIKGEDLYSVSTCLPGCSFQYFCFIYFHLLSVSQLACFLCFKFLWYSVIQSAEIHAGPSTQQNTVRGIYRPCISPLKHEINVKQVNGIQLV